MCCPKGLCWSFTQPNNRETFTKTNRWLGKTLVLFFLMMILSTIQMCLELYQFTDQNSRYALIALQWVIWFILVIIILQLITFHKTYCKIEELMGEGHFELGIENEPMNLSQEDAVINVPDDEQPETI